MLKWLFKPVKKIGHEDVSVDKKEELPVPTNIVDQILQLGTIDEVFSDNVLSRTLLCVNTESIEQLFEFMVRQKDVNTATKSGIAFGIYFRGLRIPPSECMIRLSEHIKQNNRIPARIKEDLVTIYDELVKLKSL